MFVELDKRDPRLALILDEVLRRTSPSVFADFGRKAYLVSYGGERGSETQYYSLTWDERVIPFVVDPSPHSVDSEVLTLVLSRLGERRHRLQVRYEFVSESEASVAASLALEGLSTWLLAWNFRRFIVADLGHTILTVDSSKPGRIEPLS